jgi:hypothetical protein
LRGAPEIDVLGAKLGVLQAADVTMREIYRTNGASDRAILNAFTHVLRILTRNPRYGLSGLAAFFRSSCQSASAVVASGIGRIQDLNATTAKPRRLFNFFEGGTEPAVNADSAC